MENNQTIECEDCGNTFTVEYEGKDPIVYCPFCGDEIELIEDDYE